MTARNARIGVRAAGTSGSINPTGELAAWDLLFALRTLRTPVMLSSVSLGALGLSVILDVDLSARGLLLDGLRGDPDLVVDDTLSLEACIDGRQLRFDGRFAGCEHKGGHATYLLAGPHLRFDRQRRQSYRVRLPLHRRHPLRLATAERAWSGRLLDVSCNGCGVGVEGAVDLSPGQPVDVAFGWSDLRVRCKAVVCHVARQGQQTRLGLALYLEDELPRRSIEQAVLNLQRDLLRQRRS